MRYLVSAAEMRRYDSNTIEKIGIPACVLMERAALAAAELVWKRCSGKSGKRVRGFGFGSKPSCPRCLAPP